MKRIARRQDDGFALLLVFAMAAAAAITLYMELPRAVFESARNKEELLAERAGEYKLAIKRYFVKTKTLPQSLDQLENTNGVRFLRRRYKDPMTGEPEWRLVHWGPGGYTDSKVFKPKEEQKEKRQSSIGEGYQVGGGNAIELQGEKGMQDIALRQRATDKMPAQVQGVPQIGSDGQPIADPNQPAGLGQAPPIPGQSPGMPQQPPPVPGVGFPASQPIPGQPGVGQQPGAPNQPYPGQNFQPGSPFPSPGQPAGTQPPGAFPGQTGSPGQQQVPGSAPTAGNPAALDLIRNLLTQPRQNTGGPAGATGANQPQGTVIAGIAGVASKYKGEGIKRFHERSKIDEWEFLFDPQEQQKKAAGAAAAGAAGNPLGGNATNPGSPSSSPFPQSGFQQPAQQPPPIPRR